jgi:hypothetical protein
VFIVETTIEMRLQDAEAILVSVLDKELNPKPVEGSRLL